MAIESSVSEWVAAEVSAEEDEEWCEEDSCGVAVDDGADDCDALCT